MPRLPHGTNVDPGDKPGHGRRYTCPSPGWQKQLPATATDQDTSTEILIRRLPGEPRSAATSLYAPLQHRRGNGPRVGPIQPPEPPTTRKTVSYAHLHSHNFPEPFVHALGSMSPEIAGLQDALPRGSWHVGSAIRIARGG